MSIGKMRHRVQFQVNNSVINKNGVIEDRWVHFEKPVWASVENLYGREYFAAASVQMENTLKIKIRHKQGISNNMRIIFRDRVFNIISIDNIKYQNRFIEIRVKEVSLENGR